MQNKAVNLCMDGATATLVDSLCCTEVQILYISGNFESVQGVVPGFPVVYVIVVVLN